MTKNPTKLRLKTMLQNGSSHHLRTTARIFKYGLIGFGRNIWLSITATIVMTFTLIILCATIMASVVLSSTADMMREKIDITIFLKPGTSSAYLTELSNHIKQDANVKQVNTTTSEEEYEKFLQDSSDDKELLSTLSDPEMKNIMLKSMQATMRIKVHNADDLNSIKHTVSTEPLFTDQLDHKKSPTYNTNDGAIETIASWANLAKTGGLALSAIFLIVSILVIFNTIRMAIYSRSEEIYMEKLVGADNRFIRGPFLVEAMLSGVLAGLLASAIGYLAFRFISPQLASYDIDISLISNILNSYQIAFVFLSILATGSLIGLISSRFAVHKYLKKV
ncbi:MAG: permease-like cell division protein FtsX [Candidatus Saccharibacteria bacterium]|nr:permease-like cell division protein FtsX [Candidatus Saccharibacteria bacterium]